jgi:hypothetical protein
MSSAPQPQPPQIPQVQGYKSTAQYEFTDEHGRTISGLSDNMRAFATLMKILGLVFFIFCALTAVAAYKNWSEHHVWHTWGFPVILGAIGLLAVTFGFWTSSASNSFRKIAETRNEDVWHLMNALGSLKALYGTMRTMIIAALVVAVIGAVLIVIGMWTGSGPAPAPVAGG